jgi:ribosomal protein S27AE
MSIPMKQFTKSHTLAQKAHKEGLLIKPDNCERCGKATDKLVKHHSDYDKPIDIEWLCNKCHSIEHANKPRATEEFQLVIRQVPNELHRQLKVLAAQHSITLSGLIVMALQAYVQKTKSEGK